MPRLRRLPERGFYAWHGREPSARALEDMKLRARIRAIHARSRGTYGRPRIHAELADEGERLGGKRVARLMKAEGIEGISRRKWVVTTRRDAEARPAPDLVERRFSADAPGPALGRRHHVHPDLGRLPVFGGVLDAFSRRIVGWSMAESLKTELVLEALNMAIGQRRPRGVVHHSDQGTQYTSIEFGLRCKEAKVQPSMGTRGDAYDNAMCESFFATLECELLARRRFATKAQARMAIFEFIEGGTTRRDATKDSVRSRRSSSSGVIQCIASARLPTGLRARLREKRPARSLWITACDPSAQPSTETGQRQTRFQ
jgi:putative transposase